MDPETARLQRVRLRALISFAREKSPYYRELYRGLPDEVDDIAMLPVTDKRRLMARFDDWPTDREVTRERVDAWVADTMRVGDRFLGRYLVATTSGTTGARGVFVSDDRSLRVNRVLATQMMRRWFGVRGVPRLLAGRGRMAMVAATGGHFMVAAGVARMQHGRAGRMLTKVFSVHLPLAELVEQLNRYRPAVLAGYGTLMVQLAAEQTAGRLRIRPAIVEPAGETLSEEQRHRITAAFGCKLRDVYGATECTFLTAGCRYGAYHVNADWVVVEPVEADHTPTPVGQLSHTVLITNLANRVQPILRYDLGDRVRQLAAPCACGDPVPPLEVQGRTGSGLSFLVGERVVEILSLAFSTLIDQTPGVELGQIVQTGAHRLAVRLRVDPQVDLRQTWGRLQAELDQLLAQYELGSVGVSLSDEPPQQTAGGKYRPVIPLGSVTRVP